MAEDEGAETPEASGTGSVGPVATIFDALLHQMDAGGHRKRIVRGSLEMVSYHIDEADLKDFENAPDASTGSGLTQTLFGAAIGAAPAGLVALWYMIVEKSLQDATRAGIIAAFIFVSASVAAFALFRTECAKQNSDRKSVPDICERIRNQPDLNNHQNTPLPPSDGA